jgi:hypothetical protein
MADGERRRDEDLLFEGILDADAGELLDQARRSLRRDGGLGDRERSRGRCGVDRRLLGRGGVVEGQERLFVHGPIAFSPRRRTNQVRLSRGRGVDSDRKRGSPLHAGFGRRGRLRVRCATAWRAGDPANLMRVMPP